MRGMWRGCGSAGSALAREAVRGHGVRVVFKRMGRYFTTLWCGLVAVASCGCEALVFYGRSAAGHCAIMARSRSNKEVLAARDSSAELRGRLELVERLRGFATERLALPGGESYGIYAALPREHVVWVLYAAPEFSLEPVSWSYPVVGRLDYRGFFSLEQADEAARELRARGLEVCVGGVDAYSTLGWLHDPVLSTFIGYGEADLAETLFHELAHRRVFRAGDTAFNECFASVVAEEGVKRWFAEQGRGRELRDYVERLERRRQFQREVERARDRLARLYASGRSPAAMRSGKAAVMEGLSAGCRDLRRRWGGRGLEGWTAGGINNGHLVSVQLYQDRMPELRRVLEECGGDLERFYRRCETGR